jgi:hypothetical protein
MASGDHAFTASTLYGNDDTYPALSRSCAVASLATLRASTW